MLGPKSIFGDVKGKKVTIHMVSYGTATGIGKDYSGTVVSYSMNTDSEMFLVLDTGTLVNTKYVVSIDIIE